MSFYTIRILFLIMFPALIFSGCMYDEQPIGEVVAKVNDEMLSTADVAAWEAALGEVSVPIETRRSFIRNWVEEELLFQIFEILCTASVNFAPLTIFLVPCLHLE